MSRRRGGSGNGAQGTAVPRRVGIIGAGPRGLSVLERLCALAGDATVEIHLIDPFPPGAGIVWRTDQHPDLLMNTTIGEQTIFPDPSCGISPHSTGPDMATWYRREHAASDAEVFSTFAPRALYGRYLCDSFDHICAQAPAGVSIRHHPTVATAVIEPRGAADSPAGQRVAQLIRLADGPTLEVDDIVLCVGHIPARLNEERVAWQRFGAGAHLTYLPPGLPAEADVDALQAGETVVFRGFGLNYFDHQALLSTGRGGTFAQTGTTDAGAPVLAYQASGQEPVLAPSSRRGVPYRCKPITVDHPLSDYPLRYFTPATLERLAAETGGGDLRFNDQLWPLILADLRYAWYAALYASEPEAFVSDPAALTEALAEAVDRHVSRRAAAETREVAGRPGRQTQESSAWSDVESSVIGDPERILDLHALLRPLEDRTFASRAELNAWMLDFLRRDLDAAYRGPARAPEKALFAVLWAARAYLKELIADGRVDDISFHTEVRGWFEGFVSGICDGPPPQRFAELIALAEAGLVKFVGPEVRITTSRAGERSCFRASSPAVDAPVEARALVDAASPANQVRHAADEVVTGMLDRGQLAVAELELSEGVAQPLSGLDVDPETLRTRDARGYDHPHRYCLSIQLSAVQFGLAIAANPHKSARTLRDAHRIAEQILGG